MAVSFSRFSCWLWGGKKEKEFASSSSTLSEKGFARKERDMKFPKVKKTKIVPSQRRKAKRKWQSREETRIDRELDVVLVPSDGGACLSGSESDDSDWSVGWLEPHGPDFLNDDESDDSFAVLVPCYKELESSNNELLSAIKNLPNFSSANKNYMEQWLAFTTTAYRQSARSN